MKEYFRFYRETVATTKKGFSRIFLLLIYNRISLNFDTKSSFGVTVQQIDTKRINGGNNQTVLKQHSYL